MTGLLSDLCNFISQELSIHNQIPWANVIDQNRGAPTTFTTTDIVLPNTDGTFTEVIGTGFAQIGQSELNGTVTSVQHLDTNRTLIGSPVYLTDSLASVAAAFFGQ